MKSKEEIIEVREWWKKLGVRKYMVLFPAFAVATFVVGRLENGGLLLSGVIAALLGGGFLTLLWVLMGQVDHDVQSAVDEDRRNEQSKKERGTC